MSTKLSISHGIMVHSLCTFAFKLAFIPSNFSICCCLHHSIGLKHPDVEYPDIKAAHGPDLEISTINKTCENTLLHTKYESSGPCGFGDFFYVLPMTPPPPVWTPGTRLAGFIKRTTIHCYTQNMKALGLVVSEKKIFYVFPIVSLWELMTRGAGPFLTPGARLAGFIKRTTIHCYTQNMKALGLVISEKKIFYVFPMTPPGWGPYGPQGHGWQDL